MSLFDWQAEAQQRWDERADFWNQSSEEMWERGSRKTIVPFLSKHMKPGIEIADLGCGDGYGSYKLYEAGYRVIGIDLSEEMMKKAKEREAEGLTFQQGDLTRLPLADEQMSGLMAINSLEWTEKPLDALNEMRRVLKKNGLFCLGLLGPASPPRSNSYRRLYGEPVICNTMMPWECEQLVQENGWEVIGGQGVFLSGVREELTASLSTELKQALTFMWLFMLRKNEVEQKV